MKAEREKVNVAHRVRGVKSGSDERQKSKNESMIL